MFALLVGALVAGEQRRLGAIQLGGAEPELLHALALPASARSSPSAMPPSGTAALELEELERRGRMPPMPASRARNGAFGRRAISASRTLNICDTSARTSDRR